MAPQILPDSDFGKVLTQLAREANTIVEIGSGGGMGSTLCLAMGMTRPEQVLYCVEGDGRNYRELVLNISQPSLQGKNIIPQHGSVTNRIKPFWHPDPNMKIGWWENERGLLHTEVVLPLHIDLLFLDGGEFTTDAEFLALWDRCKVIALDDIEPTKSVKNHYANTQLCLAGWKVLHARTDDRNGWAVWRRP